MLLRREFSGMVVKLDDPALGTGGEAEVYGVSGDPGLAAKVYFNAEARRQYSQKLLVMCNYPPDLPMTADGRTLVAWPIDLLSEPGTWQESGAFAGFLMPRVHEARGVIDFYNPQTRIKNSPLFDYRYLMQTARNLAVAVQVLHSRDYIIGDLKHSNILVTETALVTLVDTDSFQVRDPESGNYFFCPVLTPDFTAPELQGVALGSIIFGPEQDNFALAVLIFHLLMEGTHPFAGVYLDDGEPPPFEERIRNGHYPYGANPGPYKPATRTAPPITLLPPALRELFRQCYEEGHADPSRRPDAQTWQAALDEAAQHLIACDANPQHWYGDHLDHCPWCKQRDTQLHGTDPFPSESRIRHRDESPLDATPPAPLPDWSAPIPFHPNRIPDPVASVPAQAASLHQAANSPRALPVPPASVPATFTLTLNRRAGAAIIGIVILCLLIFFVRLANAPAGGSSAPAEAVTQPSSGNSRNQGETPTAAASVTTAFPTQNALLIYSSDGKTLLKSFEGRSALWNIATRKPGQSLSTHMLAGASTDWAIARSYNGNEALLWSVAEAKATDSLHFASGDTGLCLWACARDGKSAAAWTGGAAPCLLLWHPGRDSVSLRIASNAQPSGAAPCFSPSGDFIAYAAMQDGNAHIYIWNARTGQLLRDYSEAGGRISALAFTPDGKTLVTSGDFIILRDWETGANRHTLRPKQTPVTRFAVSDDGEWLAGLDGSGSIQIWDRNTIKSLHTVSESNSILYFCFAPQSHNIALLSGIGDIRIWDAAQSKLEAPLGHF